ncbi:MAG: transposase [Bacteroidales bacterium]|nr:transposase [Bacteroidales bacterium]
MLGRGRKNRQLDMFNIPMEKFIDMSHELVTIGNRIDWNSLENHFRTYYSDKGRPSVPVRKIVGFSLLKSRFNISVEKTLDIWLENPYWQFFCGEVHFQNTKPFGVGEFHRFKKRVGESGMERINFIAVEQFGINEDSTYKKYDDRRKRSFWEKFWGSN